LIIDVLYRNKNIKLTIIWNYCFVGLQIIKVCKKLCIFF